MHPRSTYRGERQPEGQSKKRAAFGATQGLVRSCLKSGPGVSTKSKPQPKPPQAEPVEPTSSLEVSEAHEQKVPMDLEPEPVKAEQATKGEENSEWKQVTSRDHRSNKPRAPKPPKPPTPKNPKAKAPSRKRWASWSSSGSDPSSDDVNLTLKKEGDAGLVISSEDPSGQGLIRWLR